MKTKLNKELITVSVMALVSIVIISLVIFLLITNQGGKPAEKGATEFGALTVQQSNKSLVLQCPEKLGISYFIDEQGTKSLKDDEIFITLFNPSPQSYTAELQVDGIFQTRSAITANKTTHLKSQIITDWWREDFQESPIITDSPDEIGAKDDSRRFFLISLIVDGCNKTISALAPARQISDPADKNAVAGYTIEITRSKTIIRND